MGCIFCFRTLYKQFIDELIVQPGAKQYENSRTDVTLEDHVSKKSQGIKYKMKQKY